MKTALVTDPCYLISDREWSEICESTLKGEDDTSQLGDFRRSVQELLKVISGDSSAVAEYTGFGDWVNEIDGQTFYADSGMVCVVENTPKLKEYLEKEGIVLPLGVAYIEAEDNARYEIDKSNPNWSVVKILDRRGIKRSKLSADIV